MQIRPAQPHDLVQLLEMGRLMHAESPRFRPVPFSTEKAQQLIEQLISRGGAFVAEVDGALVGMFGGVVFEHFFSTTKMAADVVLYVTPEYRGGSLAARLVHAFERWAIEAGADELVLGVSTGIEAERTAGLYERLGYERSGISLLKTAGA